MIWQDQDQWLERPELVKEDSAVKAEKSLSVSKCKLYLLTTKFIPHLMALLYVIYTILEFCGIDGFLISSFTDVSILTWIYLFVSSKVFKFCYVHRLPLYYIAINELITNLDYYVHIPVDDFNLLVIHILIIAVLIFLYTLYYIRHDLDIKKRFKTIIK